MNKHVQLNMVIIFRSASMLCSKTEQISSMLLEDTDHQSWRILLLRHSIMQYKYTKSSIVTQASWQIYKLWQKAKSQ